MAKISTYSSAAALTGAELLISVQSGGNVVITPSEISQFAFNPILKEGNYTAAHKDRVLVNTTTIPSIITLPATPTDGNFISVIDAGNNSSVNNITIDRNGNNIDGLAQDVVIDINSGRWEFIWDDANSTWHSYYMIGIWTSYIGQNLQTGTSYELVLADAGKIVEMNNGSANTLNIPANVAIPFPINTRIDVVQFGAGQTTITITSNTLRGAPKISGQYKMISLWKRAATEWVVIGGTT